MLLLVLRLLEQHGRLLNVVGRAQYFRNVWFVPAWFDFFQPLNEKQAFRLGDQADAPKGIDPRQLVRARLPRLFHFQQGLCLDNNVPLVNVAFIAIYKGERGFLEATPFACLDHYKSNDHDYEYPDCAVLFSHASHDELLVKQLAAIFWAMVLSDVNDLAAFVDFDTANGGLLRVGFDGEFFAEGLDAEDDYDHWLEVPLRVSHHGGFVQGYSRECADCYGTGVELVFPYLEACGTCMGRGTVTW